jgi:SAM-dependent methyltransferase
MDVIWEQLHASQSWGKYPAEDLIRTIMRRYKAERRDNLKVLEIGCGAGANLSFLLNEGFSVAGIDGAPSAIKSARRNLEGFDSTSERLELCVGDFSELPWENQSFDIVIDYFALYANELSVIKKTIKEVERVLKPGGHFYSRSWGKGTEGWDHQPQLELGTVVSPNSGPCSGMGVSHFFDSIELKGLLSNFSALTLKRLISDSGAGDWPNSVERSSAERVIEWTVWAER